MGGEPVIGLADSSFFFLSFCFYFFFVVRCIARWSPPSRERQRCYIEPLVFFFVVLTSCVCFLSFRSFHEVFLHLVQLPIKLKFLWFVLCRSCARASHEHDAKLKTMRRNSVTCGIQGNREGGVSGRTQAAVDENRKETADRVAKVPDRLRR